jgi:hypothetical protein
LFREVLPTAQRPNHFDPYWSTFMFLELLVIASVGLGASQSTPVQSKDCLYTQRIRSTAVLDDQTILFEMRDGSVWANKLSHRCPTLGFNESFIYETRGGQLCSIDTIQVFERHSIGGPRCGLSKFERQAGTLREVRKAFEADAEAAKAETMKEQG